MLTNTNLCASSVIIIAIMYHILEIMLEDIQGRDHINVNIALTLQFSALV
jgi:hypothetical protein